MKRIYRVTLTHGFASQKVEQVLYAWANSDAEVSGNLTTLIELGTVVEVERLKWWQWR